MTPQPRPAPFAIALIGNPNTGKTTIFNALTGLNHKVANYPGVTVERKSGRFTTKHLAAELIDLPGTYSLAARSPDEAIAVNVLLGRLQGESKPDLIVAVVDAANLERNLYLVSQLIEIGTPMIIALNMIDGAERRGIALSIERLEQELGIPVVPLRADKGIGVERLRETIERQLGSVATGSPRIGPRFSPSTEAQLASLSGATTPALSRPELIRWLVDEGGWMERQMAARGGPEAVSALAGARAAATADQPSLTAQEANARYGWVRELLDLSMRRPQREPLTRSERIDAIVTHRLWGTLILIATLTFVFQAIYRWSAPIMNVIDSGFSWLGSGIGSLLPPGPLTSLLIDGVIGGMGSVIVFLPQILLLFFFIGVLEDCGYMARAAFLMDRVLARAGLSGKSVIPLLSSFACAVPGIMSARVIEDRRDRLATILVAPLMSCSARLPVYVLLIGAFVPQRQLLGGWLGLQGLALLAAHLLGAVIAIPVLWVVKRSILQGPTPPFVMELPDYRWPTWRIVADRLITRSQAFVRRAGTIIVAVAVVVWALSYFPHPATIRAEFDAQRAVASSPDARASLDALEASAYLSQSWFGRIGRAIEPVVRPLGWDWRIGMAVMASFPAREVVIATMGTVFGLSDASQQGTDLEAALQQARRPDGVALFNLPVALSLVVFYALCCQCVATLATMRRETGSWRWPALAFVYMTSLAWLGALATYHGVKVLTGG